MEKILFQIKKIIPKKIFKTVQPFYHFFMSALAAMWYGWPSESLIVIGVTGTTGKTTTTYLLAKMLTGAGYKVGYTTTAMFSDGDKEWLNDKKMTMVGRFFTQKTLRQMVKNGCQYAIVETTSEGVAQYRHRFINYDNLIFTGLYPEHIEAHGGFDNYKEAKGKLFAHLKKCGIKYADDNKKVKRGLSGLKKIDLNRIKKTIIANGDDAYADYFLSFWAEEKFIYTTKEINPGKDIKKVQYGEVESTANGTSFSFLYCDTAGKEHKAKIKLQLLGAFNATNAMAAICLGLAQNIIIEKIKYGLENISGVVGRLEKINEGQSFSVIVDYAFEPNAVSKLYETIGKIEHNKIIHVLGSTGGGRDMARRPALGKLAGAQADYIVITNEDPYDDDPQIIIDQVALGAEHEGKKININLWKIVDRREAIRHALGLAQAGDIVLITGKGSEQAICVADGVKVPWDDRTVAREELKRLL